MLFGFGIIYSEILMLCRLFKYHSGDGGANGSLGWRVFFIIHGVKTRIQTQFEFVYRSCCYHFPMTVQNFEIKWSDSSVIENHTSSRRKCEYPFTTLFIVILYRSITQPLHQRSVDQRVQGRIEGGGGLGGFWGPPNFIKRKKALRICM